MTEKRFRLGYVCGDYGLIDNDEWFDLHSMSENSEKNVQICINKMNELADENEQLRKQREELFIREMDTKNDWRELKQENEQLKKVLGAILLEVKQEISNTKTGEIKVFINPNSFNLISEVLRKYGALKEWYE